GNLSSTEAAQITRVLPISIKADPSALGRKPGVMRTGRSSSATRSSVRTKLIVFYFSLPSGRESGRGRKCEPTRPSYFFQLPSQSLSPALSQRERESDGS